MNTIEILAPFVVGICLNNFVSVKGDICNFRQSPPPVIKYYEQGKACYIEGVFHQSCPKMSYLK
jgi:hypothetical protein